MKLTVGLLLVALSAEAQNKKGYNQECQLDAQCRLESPDLPDICCAQLVYESEGVEIKTRQCLPKSAMQDAGGEYDFEGIKTSQAYCDQAIQSVNFASAAAIFSLTLTMLSLV